MAGKGTPALAAAERAGIAFTVHEYDHDPKAASYGLEAAEKLGIDAARVFKTLVADVDGALTVAIVPVAAQLDLQALGKRASMADADARRAHDRLRRRAGSALSVSASGCRRSSTSPRSCSTTIYVSAGRRGLEIELAPADLLALTGGRTAPIARG